MIFIELIGGKLLNHNRKINYSYKKHINDENKI